MADVCKNTLKELLSDELFCELVNTIPELSFIIFIRELNDISGSWYYAANHSDWYLEKFEEITGDKLDIEKRKSTELYSNISDNGPITNLCPPIYKFLRDFKDATIFFESKEDAEDYYNEVTKYNAKNSYIIDLTKYCKPCNGRIYACAFGEIERVD